MDEPNPQATSRASVLMPALVEGAFDYLVPVGTQEGALVEAKLAGRALVGVVWGTDGEAGSGGKPSHSLGRGLGEGRSKQTLPLESASLDPHPNLSPKEGEGFPSARASRPEIPLSKLKPITCVIDTLPPLTKEFRQWLDWVSEFTLAPKGAVLSLCGLAHAAKTPKKTHAAQQFTVTLPTLTADQQAAADALLVADAKPILLDGVTGSGKTEVYFHAIAAAIGQPTPLAEGAASPPSGKQVLVLLPEIALTHQWLERFEKTFGAKPVVWHSRMTPVAKARAWQAIARGEVQVVVGARSALFLPFANLGLIIVDEEHDPSYKQEDGVLYHARDMAMVRAHFERVPIILASATPSLETMENVREGKYRTLHLRARFGAAGLPIVRMVDMRIDPPERGDFISPVVKREMLATLARGEQVLFFLNRRGYAPLLLCRGCGHRFQCADCSAWLVVHGKGVASRSLHCHHCGHREKFPDHCPACNADAEKLAPCGPGVERIAEEVRGLVANKKCGDAEGLVTGDWRLVTLSSDESIPPETWGQIESGEIDILVGTQMVAKGHHFPRLTLVVVVDADVGLDGADLRAGERTYQLLHQLGGRAGRGELVGTVLVQTYLPEHPVMKALIAHDRDRLMALEAKERKAGGWPPFGQLAAILLDGVDEAKVKAAGQMLARTAPDDARLKVLGPAPAPLSKLRGQYRYRLLVKAKPGIHLQRTLRNWLKGQKFPGVRVKVDVNPYYFM